MVVEEGAQNWVDRVLADGPVMPALSSDAETGSSLACPKRLGPRSSRDERCISSLRSQLRMRTSSPRRRAELNSERSSFGTIDGARTGSMISAEPARVTVLIPGWKFLILRAEYSRDSGSP